MIITAAFDESDRQTILLALGHLAVERPGWDYRLGEIADNLKGRKDYEQYREMYKDQAP